MVQGGDWSANSDHAYAKDADDDANIVDDDANDADDDTNDEDDDLVKSPLIPQKGNFSKSSRPPPPPPTTPQPHQQQLCK